MAEIETRTFSGDVVARGGEKVPISIEYAPGGRFCLRAPGRCISGTLTERADREAVERMADNRAGFDAVVRRLFRLSGGGRGVEHLRDIHTRDCPIQPPQVR